MRIALISDIHANLPALEAVLSDADQLAVDQLICLGDIADLGPKPSETVARIRELACPTILGNHDLYEDTQHGPPVVVAFTEWCRAQLSSEDLSYLRNLPRSVDIDLGGGRLLRCVHGIPDNLEKGLTTAIDHQGLNQILANQQDVDILCGGHTHVQMMRRHGRTLLVNVGSVGAGFEQLPDGKPPQILPWAEYAVVEATASTLSVDLRRVDYDCAQFVAHIRSSTMPSVDRWAQQWEF